MKAKGKKVTLTQMSHDMSGALREVFVRQPGDWWALARERMRDLPKTNFDLGCQFASEGRWQDALVRFKMVQFLRQGYPNLWYNLGTCYFRLDKNEQAANALRKALQQDPSNVSARFMLASVAPESLNPQERPQAMPRDMVAGYFGRVAQGYDIREAEANYQGGLLIHELLKPLMGAPSPHVLDLGCGTGIAARPWRKQAAQMVGVDVTPAMLALAEKASHAEKKLFDQLVEADLHQLPAALPAADVILLVNVVQYVGNLAPMLQRVAALLNPGGTVAITLEPYEGQGGFGLSAQTGRFGHKPEYLKQLGQQLSLAVVKEASLEIYAGRPQAVIVLGKR